MKTHLCFVLGAALLCALAPAGRTAPGTSSQDQLPGYVEFGKFSAAEASGQFVEVNIQRNLISMVARLAEKSEPEMAELLRGLHLVRVNVLKPSEENRAGILDRIKAIREQLTARDWQSIVTVKNERDDVGIHIKLQGEEAIEGLVITAFPASGEAVLVNIVGNIRPEKVGLLGERLNIPPLAQLGSMLPAK
jgi:hypothetical protein